MSAQRHVVYLYDGTFQGALCCVFESYSAREVPNAIYSQDTLENTLFPVKEIITDTGHYQRVFGSISAKICHEALELVQLCFLSCHPQKELCILRFLRVGYRYGCKAVHMLQDPDVSEIQKMVLSMRHEAHLLTGFLRFQEFSGALAAVIEPKNEVLPLLGPHFSSRYPEETFLIYNKSHGSALFYRPYSYQILPIESLELPAADEKEIQYQRLWKRFCSTIAIEGRINPVCQRTHCPKRYWGNMVEMDTAALPSSSSHEKPVQKSGPALPAAVERDRIAPQ